VTIAGFVLLLFAVGGALTLSLRRNQSASPVVSFP